MRAARTCSLRFPSTSPKRPTGAYLSSYLAPHTRRSLQLRRVAGVEPYDWLLSRPNGASIAVITDPMFQCNFNKILDYRSLRIDSSFPNGDAYTQAYSASTSLSNIVDYTAFLLHSRVTISATNLLFPTPQKSEDLISISSHGILDASRQSSLFGQCSGRLGGR